MSYKLAGFGGYKDGTFRIIFKDSKKGLKSVPLDKTDRLNYKSNMSKETKNKLIEKYLKRI